MIQDHRKIWLLYPGFTLEQFGKLPEWLDETDKRGGAEQLGERWQPLDGRWGFKCYGWDSGSRLWNGSQSYELLGAIHLRCDLVMLFEDNLVATVNSTWTLEVARVDLQVPADRAFRRVPEPVAIRHAAEIDPASQAVVQTVQRAAGGEYSIRRDLHGLYHVFYRAPWETAQAKVGDASRFERFGDPSCFEKLADAWWFIERYVEGREEWRALKKQGRARSRQMESKGNARLRRLSLGDGQ